MKKEIRKTKTTQGVRNSFKLFAIVLMVLACITGCKKDSDSSGGSGAPSNLSTPSWLQGTWKGQEGTTLKITKDDIIVDGKTFKETYIQGGCTNISIKQTKKSESLYVLTVNAMDDEGDIEECHVFKIGDGTYISVANSVDPEQISNIDNIAFEKFDKVSGGGGGGDDETGKFSPPSWIIGTWESEEDEEGVIDTFEFTSTNIFWDEDDLFDTFAGYSNLSIKETKNTSSLYEITLTGTSEKGNLNGYLSFKKGNGKYIYGGSNTIGTPMTDNDYTKLTKID